MIKCVAKMYKCQIINTRNDTKIPNMFCDSAMENTSKENYLA